MAVKSKRWATSTAEKTLRAVEGKKDERPLVDAARQDPARFAELYDNNFERVYAYVARRVRDRDEAEDVTSEVFREALASLHRFEWRGLPFVAWLLRIASNVLSDRWRRLSMAHEIGPDDVEQIGVDDDIEQRAILYQLVETLPVDQRRVIILRFAGQKSLREIAIVLERSEGAIKQLQLRALQNLRERIRSKHG